MLRLLTFTFFILHLGQYQVNSQSLKFHRTVDYAIITDSASTMFFPVRYNGIPASDEKIALSGDYYANLLCYNFEEDKYLPLFSKDVFIEAFLSNDVSFRPGDRKPGFRNITNGIVILLVKDSDTNKNGRIDNHDPSRLYICDTRGNGLKLMTNARENVLSFTVYEKQGLALFRIQFDSDNNGDFRKEDRRIYFRKLNLLTLETGREIGE